MRKKLKLDSIAREMWQPVLLGSLGIVLATALLGINYASIAPNIAPAELNVLSRSFSGILSDPLYIHQQIIQKITFALTGNQILAIRLPSILTGIIVIIGYYALISLWFTRRVAVFSVLLFATSSWFLHVARIGTIDAAYLLPVACVMAAAWMKTYQRTTLAVFGFLLFSGILLYVPGMVWFLVPVLIWQRRVIVQLLKRMDRWHIGLFVVMFMLIVTPLIIALARDTTYMLRIAALSADINVLSQTPKNALTSVSDIFLRRTNNPLFGVGTVPYMSIFTTAMVILGTFAAFYNRRLDRMKLLIGLLIGGLLLTSVSDDFSIAFMIVPLYMLAAGGIAFLLQRWFTVFPKNPFARQIGVIVVLAAVVMNVLFGLTRYFIAWPHSPETEKAFTSDSAN